MRYAKSRIQNYLLSSSLVLSALGASGALAQSIDDVFNIPDRPSLNFYGLPGIIDMPSAEPLPDGQIAVGVSHFGGITRTNLSFQVSPRITATFRYVGIQDWNSDGFDTYRDRSFDVRFLLNRESRRFPAVTLGLQDFAGTGIYAGEYIAATKTFAGGRIPGKLKVTGGLGWGRLASSGAIGAPFGAARPAFDPSDTGGEPSFDQWFRGDTAPFAGIEWQIDKKWGLKAEYSSDAYTAESVDRAVFTRKSRFNFGVEYQYSRHLRLGAYYLYGSEFGINAQLQLNPKQPVSPMRVAAPQPVAQRPSRSAAPDQWNTNWTTVESAPTILRDAMKAQLEAEGLDLIEMRADAHEAEVRFGNDRYRGKARAVGRVARAMARVLPASVETFRIVPYTEGLALSAVTMRRSDLESLEFDPQAADALLAVTGFGAASPILDGAVQNPDIYPDFSWSIGPYVSPSYFDPDDPVRADAGVSFGATYRPAPGWKIAGTLRHRLVGSRGDSVRLSNSVLPHVRTDSVLYARGGDTTLNNLYVSKQWKPGANVYARTTAGYLETMYGGVSAEVLWKPVASRLALGVEVNYVKQRDFDQRLGFQDYSVATGHASVYYEFGKGYLGQLDVGRYLAGDVGATLTLSREFANGWKLGGFFTITDVSAADFGEGSFDKGINVTIPISWFLGQPDTRSISTTIRPIQRDGGARLNVPGRLYEQVRSGHRNAISSQWPGVWE